MSYDSVPASAAGLDYARTVRRPVRGAVVEVVGRSPPVVLGGTTTDAGGAYSVTWTGTSAVSLRVKAQTLAPPLRVQDLGDALYALDSGPVDATAATAVSLNAGSGWTGSSYGGPRSAGPFAILDALYSAAQAFLAVAPATVFPELRANWSPGNVVGTYYDLVGHQLYVLGEADVDTDEYDTHVVIHEWGHYYEDVLSRADTPGGSHGLGDLKDPRLAFSEGWGDALGAMVLHPDDVYADTMGLRQTMGFEFSLESNAADDPSPGWWSEMSVAHALYDLFDPPSDADGDAVALGFGPIHAAMVGAQRSTPAFTTLFSFADALKAAQPAQAAAVDALLSARSVADPVRDAWGTGETHDGGWAANLPVYTVLAVNGGGASVGFLPSADRNDLASNRFLRFTGTGGTVTVTAGSAAVDVSLQVWRRGQVLGSADAWLLGPETVSGLPTVAGEDYLVLVTGWETTGPGYSVPVAVTSP
ncbi:MAG TPA: hypothetical protein VFF02_19690 [Anaeromyxobacteraceae bacterium]|nr:hypothetical protein [Anaeromyxobacteraceae bacterium]